MSVTLNFHVCHQNITRADSCALVADSLNYAYAHFDFCSSDWDGLIKTAVFTRGQDTYEQILEDDQCLIPWEVLPDGKGIFTVSVFAGNRITTNVVKVKLDASGWSFALESSQPPTEGVYSQILTRLADVEDTVVESAESAAQSATSAAESAQSAEQSMEAARTAKNAAEEAAGSVTQYSKTSESWAVGGTGTRTGEDTDNSKYYAEQAGAASQTAVSAGNTATGAAQAATQAAGSASQSARTAAEGAQIVQELYNGAVSDITAAKTAAVGAIQTKGDQVLDSIPEDYTELSGDVTALKADLSDSVSDLKSALTKVGDIFGGIKEYKAYSDLYISSSGITTYEGVGLYEIPVNAGDIVLVSDSGASKFYGSIVLGNVFNFKNSDGTFTHLGTGYDTKFVIRSDQDKYMIVIPSGVIALSICADDNYYQNVSYCKNTPSAKFNEALLGKNQVVSLLNTEWVIASNFYARASDGTFRVLSSNAFTFPVKAGDRIKFQSLISPFTYYGTFKDKSTLNVVNITTDNYTATSDGYVFAFGDNTSGITYYPFNGIKLDKSNIIGGSKILDGKVYCAFGDSITAGNNLLSDETNWIQLVVNELGGTLVNCGVGSSRVAGNQGTAFHKDARLDNVKAANPDIVTIMGGANDLVAGYAIGDESQFILPLAEKNTMTYLGAYSYVIESLLTWKPSLQIVIIGMYYAYTDGTEYSDTLTYQMLSDASEKLAKHYCLPFVDLHHDTGFNQFTMGTSPNNIYTRDRIHPNQLGCNKIASIVIDKFKEVFST